MIINNKNHIKKRINTFAKILCEKFSLQQLKNQLLYYEIVNDIVLFIMFDLKSYGYEPGIYVVPLYLPHEDVTLSIGNSLDHLSKSNDFTLYTDYDNTQIDKTIDKILNTITDLYPKIRNDFDSPRKLIDGLTCNKYRFFIEDVYKHEVLAYSELLLNNQENALHFFDLFEKEILQYDKPYIALKQKEVSLAKEVIRGTKNSEEFFDLIVSDNIKKLGLIYHY